jgi:hypothetical protein
LLPLVNLSVLRPIVQCLRERGVIPESVLESVGLTEAAVESEEGAVQDDGFMISLALSIFERALGPRLDPNRLVIVVCDPTVLPDRLKPFQVLRGDRMGFRIRFPSEWLALPLDDSTAPFGDGKRDDGTAAPDFLAGFVAFFAIISAVAGSAPKPPRRLSLSAAGSSPDSLHRMVPIFPRNLRAPNGTSRKTASFIAANRSRKSLQHWVTPTLRIFPARSPGKRGNPHPSSVGLDDCRRREAVPNGS